MTLLRILKLSQSIRWAALLNPTIRLLSQPETRLLIATPGETDARGQRFSAARLGRVTLFCSMRCPSEEFWNSGGLPGAFLAAALHLRAVDFDSGRPLFMNRPWKLTGGMIALLLGALCAVPHTTRAQNVSADSSGRKVRSKVVPAYPDIARSAHITGKVKIEATIAADGHVSATRVVGGSPILVNAAVEALEKWRFEAAPSDTTEVIEFEFDGEN
jgi:TonB family protein